MKKILYLLTVILVFPGLLLAAELPTMEEILGEVARQTQAQRDNLQDLQCRQIVILESPSGNTVTTESDLYVKQGGKQRNVVYNEAGQVEQIQIVNNDEISIIDYRGQRTNKKVSEILTNPEKESVKNEVDGKQLPGSVRYYKNPSQFTVDYRVTLDMSASKSGENSYVLKVQNRIDPVTQKEVANDFFKSMEITIDYAKGVVLKEAVYNVLGELRTEDSFEEYTHFGQSPEDFWYNSARQEKVLIDTNRYVVKTVRQENIKINQGLDEGLFQ